MSDTTSDDRTVKADTIRLSRLVRLLPALLGGERSRSALLALLAGQSGGTTLSTLTRDIRLLRRMGWLAGDGLKSGAYRPGPDLPLWLSPEESAAIALARRVLGQLGLPEAARLSHLEARCAVRDETGMSAETGLLPSVPGQVDPGIWSAVLLAIGTGRRMRLTYRKQTGEMAAPVLLDRIEPCWMTGAIYLVAIKAEALAGPFDWQALREYRLDRVLALDVTEAPCSLSELPWLRVVFHVDATLHERLADIRTSEGKSIQEVRDWPDGTLRVVTHETGLVRARHRILALAPHIRSVEGPPALLEALRTSTQRLAETLTKLPSGCWGGRAGMNE